ncbi:hypothetical protein KIPB_013479, partial [Kipferlia bialata]
DRLAVKLKYQHQKLIRLRTQIRTLLGQVLDRSDVRGVEKAPLENMKAQIEADMQRYRLFEMKAKDKAPGQKNEHDTPGHRGVTAEFIEARNWLDSMHARISRMLDKEHAYCDDLAHKNKVKAKD